MNHVLFNTLMDLLMSHVPTKSFMEFVVNCASFNSMMDIVMIHVPNMSFMDLVVIYMSKLCDDFEHKLTI